MSKIILLVSDNPEKSGVLEAALTSGGYETNTLEDASNIVETAIGLKPDLVIVDINIPIKDGYKICRDLRENADTQHVKVIFVKNENNPLENAWAVVKGADFYFTTRNPFSEDNLVQSMSIIS